MSGDKCLKIQWALNVRATNVWKSKWALNVRRQMSENSHWRQMSLGVKCHMPISRQMSLASIVTTSNRRQRSGLKSLGDKRPGRQTAWINQTILPVFVHCASFIRYSERDEQMCSTIIDYVLLGFQKRWSPKDQKTTAGHFNPGPVERFKSWLGHPYLVGIICLPG